MRLNELNDNPGATKARIRVGRGIGSGKGKTGGRGVKGQKSRSGVAIKGFEGGQMPIHMRLPKRGFNKPNRKQWTELSIATLGRAIEAGKLDLKKDICACALVEAGVVRRAKDGVRLIGGGKLSKAVKLVVNGATPCATKIVEDAKGSVTIVEGKPSCGKAEKAAPKAKPVKAKPAPKAEAKPKAAPKPKAEAKPKAAPKPKAEAKKAPAKKAPAKKAEASDESEYLRVTREYDAKVDGAVVTKIEKYLGASLKNRDAKYVACSDETELNTIVKGFMKKKLGIDDKDAAMEKVKAVCVTMKPTRMKNRVTFYYLLAQNEGKLGEF